MPAAESLVSSRNVLPPGRNTSICLGRSPPADSTRYRTGSEFWAAIPRALSPFARPMGLIAPPLSVGSFATMTHSTPSMTPMPVTTPAPMLYSVLVPAIGDSSRNGASRSRSNSTRSRANNFPRLWWRVTYLSPPPTIAFASNSSTAAMCSAIAAALARNSGERVSMAPSRTVMVEPPRPDPRAS